MRRNVLEILPQLSVEQPMVSGKIAMVSWHMVNDPQALRRMMADNVTNYPKSVVMNNVLTLGLGHSLFTAKGKTGVGNDVRPVPRFPTEMYSIGL